MGYRVQTGRPVHEAGPEMFKRAQCTAREREDGWSIAMTCDPSRPAPDLIPTPSDHLTPKAAVAVFCSALWSGFSPPLTARENLHFDLAPGIHLDEFGEAVGAHVIGRP